MLYASDVVSIRRDPNGAGTDAVFRVQVDDADINTLDSELAMQSFYSAKFATIRESQKRTVRSKFVTRRDAI